MTEHETGGWVPPEQPVTYAEYTDDKGRRVIAESIEGEDGYLLTNEHGDFVVPVCLPNNAGAKVAAALKQASEEAVRKCGGCGDALKDPQGIYCGPCGATYAEPRTYEWALAYLRRGGYVVFQERDGVRIHALDTMMLATEKDRRATDWCRRRSDSR